MCIVRQVNESEKYHHLPVGLFPSANFFVIVVVLVVIAVILVAMACGGGGSPYTKSNVIVSIL
jgi:hypothetical protein